MNQNDPRFREVEEMLKSLARQDQSRMDDAMTERLLRVIDEEHAHYLRRRRYRRLAQCAAAVAVLTIGLTLMLNETESAPPPLAATLPPPASAKNMPFHDVKPPEPSSFFPEANHYYPVARAAQFGFAAAGDFGIELDGSDL